MLYNALWYFPILMIAGGLSTIMWDYKFPHKVYRKIKSRGKQVPRNEEDGNPDSQEMHTVPTAPAQATTSDSTTRRTAGLGNTTDGPPADLQKDNTVTEQASPRPMAAS